ncbi:hypothetical protein ACFVMC_00220 [Nocardia sp. NPDC127579]|uniref:hypothetical protein n=1 Tax=Nocardia sp. NPDC127579 TaxID=3345402 RepID=UPI00362A981A
MPQFSVDFNKLLSVTRAWDEASTALGNGAAKADAIDPNSEVVWGIFQNAWGANLRAAQYLRDRMKEGQTETDSMGNTLAHVSKVLQEQDQNFANVLHQLEGDVR